MADNQDDSFNASKAEVFEALGHPTRIRILQELSEKPLPFSELKRAAGLESNGLLTFHLGKLSGLATLNPEGAYALTDEGREALRIIEASRTPHAERGSSRRSFHLPRQNRQKALLAGFVLILVVLGSVAVYQQEQIAALNNDVSSYSQATHSALQFRTVNVSMPSNSQSPTYDPYNGYVYASYGDGSSGGVSVVSGTTSLANITLDSGPGPILYDPSNHLIYAAGINSNRASVINGTDVIATIPYYSPFSSFYYNPANGLVYATNQVNGVIGIINRTQMAASVNVGRPPSSLVYDPSNGFLYASNSYTNTVAVINGTAAVSTIAVGVGPTSLLFDPSNGYVYVADEGAGFGGAVSVIDGTAVAGTVTVGASPSSFLYDPSNHDVYVVNSGDDTVSIIVGATNIANVSLGFIPSTLVYDPSDQYVYAPNTGGNNVSVISGTHVIATLTTGFRPTYALYNPSNGYVYVSNSGFFGVCLGGCPIEPSNVVSVISGTTVLANVTVGYYPKQLLYNPSDHFVYAMAGDGMTAIATSTA
jgi:YVTN family beta-propeller protein